jgi:hypothetical protein
VIAAPKSDLIILQKAQDQACVTVMPLLTDSPLMRLKDKRTSALQDARQMHVIDSKPIALLPLVAD